MVSLGLDVSELRLGWAFVSYDEQRPLALGVEDLRKRDGGYLEEQVITAMREVRDRLRALGHDSEEVVVAGIESAYHGPSIKRTIAHAGVIGMATVAAQVTFGRQLVCMPLGADEWRAACGISNAGKSADKKAATARWAVVQVDFANYGPEGIAEDAADALGLATAAALLTEKRSEEAA